MTTILEHADSLISGDREVDYGSFEENAERLAILWGMILGCDINPEQVPLMLCALKFMRLCNQPTHTDSWVDLAGYVGCAGKLNYIWGDKT